MAKKNLTPKRLAKILNGAADLIESGDRWTQGSWKGLWRKRYRRTPYRHPQYGWMTTIAEERVDEPCYCAMGAAFCVANELGLTEQQVTDALGGNVSRIIAYNDAAGRRPETMAKYLRKLAAEYAG